MMRTLQTGQPVILFQIQRTIQIAASVAIVLVAIAMITACVYALANMLHATFGAYVLASLMVFVVVSLGVAVVFPLLIGQEQEGRTLYA